MDRVGMKGGGGGGGRGKRKRDSKGEFFVLLVFL